MLFRSVRRAFGVKNQKRNVDIRNNGRAHDSHHGEKPYLIDLVHNFASKPDKRWRADAAASFLLRSPFSFQFVSIFYYFSVLVLVLGLGSFVFVRFVSVPWPGHGLMVLPLCK